jgi:hypothetical protein
MLISTDGIVKQDPNHLSRPWAHPEPYPVPNRSVGMVGLLAFHHEHLFLGFIVRNGKLEQALRSPFMSEHMPSLP